MLRQQINLFPGQAKNQGKTEILSWQQLMLSFVSIAALFFVLFLFSIGQYYYYAFKHKHTLQKISLLQKQFIAIKSTYPASFFSKDRVQSASQLQTDLATQEKILSEITNKIPFSAHLVTFAKIITPNVWLTAITIDKSGKQINLKGKSLSMQSLQGFLTNVLHDKSFEAYTLNLKDVENTSKDTANTLLTFEIEMAKKT